MVKKVSPHQQERKIKPSDYGVFGELGGPKQFNMPSGVAYFRRVVYVADKGNNRIARYKLTSDFE